MSLLSEGQIVRDTYEVECLLGEGAFAEVYRIKHRFLGRQAMKVFKAVGMTIQEIERALSEAIILSRIGHPNIIRVFDANVTTTSQGTCGFFTMEYVAGGTLENFWRSHRNCLVPIEITVDIIQQVCRGLSVGHSESPPVIHRDIKPQNILIGYDAGGLRVRVSDFGLAKRVNPLTLLASAKGTRKYKPPEIFRNLQSDSCAGDVWAVGSVLYLLLTDHAPFEVREDTEVLDTKCFDHPPVLPSLSNALVDPFLEKICLRALSLKPQDRYPHSMDLLRELSQWKPKQVAARDGRVLFADESKSVLGIPTPANEELGRKMVDQAIHLSQQAGKLGEAADLMEEAINKSPSLRADREQLLKLWRRGIVAPLGGKSSLS
jgi:eukaryotic-like serine/threonine-protein kinase